MIVVLVWSGADPGGGGGGGGGGVNRVTSHPPPPPPPFENQKLKFAENNNYVNTMTIQFEYTYSSLQ